MLMGSMGSNERSLKGRRMNERDPSKLTLDAAKLLKGRQLSV